MKIFLYQNLLKRLLDILVVLSIMLVFSPVFALLCMILFVANGKAGVFFSQERVGYKERIFKIIKFKTMNEKKDTNGNLLPDIKRITPFGRWMRELSLDELPQLINVLKGDMSLVGPRPLLVQYLPLYSSEQKRRHDVLPGITGWAQCNGRNNMSWTKKFELDVWYVDHQSFRLDLLIFWRTLCKVLKRADIDNDTIAEKKVTTPLFDGTN